MAKSSGKLISDSAYNQASGKEDTPERMDPYNEYEETIARHGSTENASLESTVNSKSGEGIMGHGADGELHAINKGYKGRDK